MKSQLQNSILQAEPFVDAREAAYTLNLPMYYLTNAAQRKRMAVPHYRIGRMIRFKLSELETWLSARGEEDSHA
jgi:excisionase family DNA binding protein